MNRIWARGRILRKLKRMYGSKCYYCGRKLTSRQCTIDHVVPRSKGGEDSLSNYVLACGPCNWEKADTLITPSKRS